MIKDGQFVEYAHVHKNVYGTSIQAVRSVMKQNKICILDIDIQGVKSILNGPAHAELNPHYLFVQPKSFGDLEARLRKRKSDSEEQIQIRVATARKELEASKSVPFEKFLTNDVLEDAYNEFEICSRDTQQEGADRARGCSPSRIRSRGAISCVEVCQLRVLKT